MALTGKFDGAMVCGERFAAGSLIRIVVFRVGDGGPENFRASTCVLGLAFPESGRKRSCIAFPNLMNPLLDCCRVRISSGVCVGVGGIGGWMILAGGDNCSDGDRICRTAG